MKKLFALALTGLMLGTVTAQQEEWCGSDAHLEELLNQSDEWRAYYEAKTEEQINRSLSGAVSRDDETIIIPTVVHIIHSDCDGSISQAQVHDGMRILNTDMQRLNEDSNDTRAVFTPYAAGVNVEFRLAKVDPNGDPTNGITRTQNAFVAQNGGQNAKSLVNWPSDEYFNIWVVETIAGGGQGTILGYAQFPGSGAWSTFGIVIRNDAFGTIGTSNADGRTLTHEVGHCLNLFHTFQGGCGSSNCNFSGDRICDTPPTVQPTYACDFSLNTCSNDATGNSPYPAGTPDMIENYMSYNSCQNLFTAEQAERMLAVFDVHAVLENLVSEENLVATGVGGFLAADFAPAYDIVVQNRTTGFLDLTRFGADAWEWNFGESSFPPTSTDENPEVNLINVGLHPVTLTASKDTSELSVTKEILVVSQEGHYIPFTDGFEDIGSLPSDSWLAKNADEDENSFVVTSGSAYSGDNAVYLENEGTCEAYSDELITQSLDFSPFDEVTMTFKAAYARRNAESTDYLRIYTSRNYGESWELLTLKGSASLSSVSSFEGSSWFPQNTSEWKEQEVTFFQSNLMREGIMVKLEFVSEGGNNFFMDEVEFTGDFTGELLLKSPKDGTQGLRDDVMIDWKAVGNANFYEYQIDRTVSFNSENLISGTKDFIDNTPENEDTEFLAEDLQTSTQYFWRVRYERPDGSMSDWSDVWSFNVSEDGLGQEEIAVEDWKLYPNPAAGLVTLASTNGELKNVRLIDISGRIIKQMGSNGGSTHQFQVDDLTAGMYIVQIESAEGEVVTRQLIVR